MRFIKLKKEHLKLLALAGIGGLLVGGAGFIISKKMGQSSESTVSGDQEEKKEDSPEGAFNVYVTAKDGLNLRSSASTSASVLGAIPYGTEIIVIEVSADSAWYKVKWEDKEGFVKAEFTSKERPPEPNIRDLNFVESGLLDFPSGAKLEAVIYTDLNGDDREDAVVPVRRSQILDYYVFAYTSYTLNKLHERKNLFEGTVKVEGAVIVNTSKENGTTKTERWKYNGELFVQV